MVLDVPAGGFRFEWRRVGAEPVVASGLLSPCSPSPVAFYALEWEFHCGELRETDRCFSAAASARALLKRILNWLPLDERAREIGFVLDAPAGTFEAGIFHKLRFIRHGDWALQLGGLMRDFVNYSRAMPAPEATSGEQRGRAILRALVPAWVGLSSPELDFETPEPSRPYRLRVTLQIVQGHTEFHWTNRQGAHVANGTVRCCGTSMPSPPRS